MDFDSPEDVDKDFPGLSKKGKEESDYSDGGDHEKRRKDKKEKGKDRGYAALEGESSPEEELDAKSPSKSKKSKAFKFTSSKSKEKREKSRDKEKADKETKEDKEDKPREKEKQEKEKDKDSKKKDKERKEKDRKDKTKDKEKEKKEKKIKQSSTVSEEVLELGDVQPVFGVSVSLATERSRCHDGVNLPLVVRDCIDYLQEFGLKSDQIYKVEPVKTRLQQFKRLYNNRERQPDEDVLDIPTACGLLKLFLRELPEPILTTDMIVRFEEVASVAYEEVIKQQEDLQLLLEQLPQCNRTLLAWILLHFDNVIQHEKQNKLNAQSLAMLLSPPLQISHRLMVTMLCHTPNLFATTHLNKYVPPITASSPKLPATPDEIQIELRKQESLLTQIHSEMNAGFVSKKREEQLWEVQRIITQLKRKLRSFETTKRQEKSIDEQASLSSSTIQAAVLSSDSTDCIDNNSKRQSTQQLNRTKQSCSDDDSTNTTGSPSNTERNQGTIITSEVEVHPQPLQLSPIADCDDIYVDKATGFLMVSKTHADYESLLRLQLENQELMAWKTELQGRIGAERAEILHLKQQLQIASGNISGNAAANGEESGLDTEGDYEKVIENYIRENVLLEHKRQMLAKEIFDERRECIAMQIELTMRQF